VTAFYVLLICVCVVLLLPTAILVGWDVRQRTLGDQSVAPALQRLTPWARAWALVDITVLELGIAGVATHGHMPVVVIIGCILIGIGGSMVTAGMLRGIEWLAARQRDRGKLS
jgi:hypothetical protein